MKSINILIVEDELLIAENLAIQLKKLKYNVIDIVSSGKAAIEKVELHEPDLILMDIAIKGKLDGIETAAIIQENHQIAIIFLTAYADDKTLERASLTGCYGYILKPFKDRELHATIKMALKKHQQQLVVEKSLDEVTDLLREYQIEKSHIYEDSLTKLPTRLMLRELFGYLSSELENLASPDNIQGSSSSSKKLMSVIFIKLDRFERILASLGNEKSDVLIKGLTQRLTEHITSYSHEGVLIRLEYDEFCILLSGLEQRQIASDFVKLAMDKLRQPLTTSGENSGENIFLTASMGISFYPFDNIEIDHLLGQAKQAMVYAQEQGGNKYKLYTSAFRIITSSNSNDLSLEAALHQAVGQNKLELYYQPKVNLITGKIHSAEALIRWDHPQLGLISPHKILPLAEACGLMDKIGDWVLETACKQTQIWHQVGFNLRIAVNLSGHQFKQSNLFHKLTQLLFEFNLDAKSLELELTEQILVENVQSNIQKLNLIKKLGIKITLDDFGTGYSSLGYLHQFPFDILKIDRCFITNINQNPKNAVITKSVIEMAHQLGLKVVGEGVETQAELDFLVKHQCDEIQGYFFARPLPIRDFEKLLMMDKCFITVAPQLSQAHQY